MPVRILPLIVVALFGLPACQHTLATEADLEPIESALTCHTPAYQLHLRETLMRKAPAHCEVQFLVLPAFEPEMLVSLYPVDGGFEAQVVRPSRQIWGAGSDGGPIDCGEARASVPVAVAARLTRLWRAMLARTRYSQAKAQVLDGVGYQFFSWRQGLGSWGGGVANPPAGSRAFVLARVGSSLAAYVEAQAADQAEHLCALTEAMDRLDSSLARVAAR
jgi:hypothetical protein